MLKNELGTVGLLIGAVFSSAACGGEHLEVSTSVHGQDPSCGRDCPETCWVDIVSGSPNVGHWFIFNANELPETPLRNAVASLTYTGNQWTKEVADAVDDPVQQTVYGAWIISEGFNIYASGLKAEIIMGSPVSPMECGVDVN